MTKLARVPAEVLVLLAGAQHREGLTLSRIAHALGRPPSSVQRALDAMMRDGEITAYLGSSVAEFPRPRYRLNDTAPLPALVEVARWSVGAERVKQIERAAVALREPMRQPSEARLAYERAVTSDTQPAPEE